MAGGRLVSEFEHGQIEAYIAEGKNFSEIARILNRTRQCIAKCAKRLQHPFIPKLIPGPKRKLSDRVLRMVKRSLRGKTFSCNSVIRRHNMQVSKWTLARALKRSNFQFRRMLRRPAWKPYHLTNRLTFARAHMHWNMEWRTVIFSDEKKWNLDGPDGFKCYWHSLGGEFKHYSKRVGGGKSIMLWCGFGFGGKFDMKLVRGRINALGYQQMLQEVDLVNNGELFAGENFVFQQDNAPPHAVRNVIIFCLLILIFMFKFQARSTKAWLHQRNIRCLDWPSLSPDLNPVENIWASLARDVYRDGRQFEDTNTLLGAINQAWDHLDLNVITDLVDSMKNRLYHVIYNHGRHSGY